MLLQSSIKTPLGVLNLIARDQILLTAGFSATSVLLKNVVRLEGESTPKSTPKILGITNLISDYFDGDLSAIEDIEVSQSGGSFSQKAWKAMRKVRAGKTVTYSQLAKSAGSPNAVRAAGTACARNAIVLVVPCHRIVKTGGALGNYAYGVHHKEWLLAHEGAIK